MVMVIRGRSCIKKSKHIFFTNSYYSLLYEFMSIQILFKKFSLTLRFFAAIGVKLQNFLSIILRIYPMDKNPKMCLPGSQQNRGCSVGSLIKKPIFTDLKKGGKRP